MTAPAPARTSAVAPLAIGAGAAAACALLLVADPNRPGFYPTCPFLAVTGRWCPLCGSLRATRALLQGDVVAAVGLNALLVIAAPYVIYRWVYWLASTRGRRLPALDLPRWGIWLALGVVAVFWVARNVPWAPLAALAP